MKKTLLITAFAAMAAIFTVSCGGKEESKIPKSMDELWGTTWEAASVEQKNTIWGFIFAAKDSIVFYGRESSVSIEATIADWSVDVYQDIVYKSPDLLANKQHFYFNGFNSGVYNNISLNPPLSLRFTEDGYFTAISWNGPDVSIQFKKVK